MSGTECGMLEKKQEGRFFMYIGNHLSSAKGYEAMGKRCFPNKKILRNSPCLPACKQKNIATRLRDTT